MKSIHKFKSNCLNLHREHGALTNQTACAHGHVYICMQEAHKTTTSLLKLIQDTEFDNTYIDQTKSCTHLDAHTCKPYSNQRNSHMHSDIDLTPTYISHRTIYS